MTTPSPSRLPVEAYISSSCPSYEDELIINDETIHNLNKFTPNLAIVNRFQSKPEDKLAIDKTDSLFKSPIKFVVKGDDYNINDDMSISIPKLNPIPYHDTTYVPLVLNKKSTFNQGESNETVNDNNIKTTLLQHRSLKLIKQMLDIKKNRYLDGEDDNNDGGNLTYDGEDDNNDSGNVTYYDGIFCHLSISFII